MARSLLPTLRSGLAAALLAAAASAQATPRATLLIDPPVVSLLGSTFSTSSFVLTNDSTSGERIYRFRIDVSTAFQPDVVFDPWGLAGNDLGKDFTIDSGFRAGLTGRTWLFPHDGGYDALEATFDNFTPGRTLTFSMDSEPTTIFGTDEPGPNEAGKISGLEMMGGTFEVEFDDGTTLVGDLFAVPGTLDASQVVLRAGAPPAPGIAIPGEPVLPASTTEPAQTVRITGTPFAAVRLHQVEAGLFVHAVPNGGFDVDPYETNTAVAVVEHTATLDAAGVADVPVTLTALGTEVGYHYFVAVELDGAGVPGRTAAPLLLRLLAPGPDSARINLNAHEPWVGVDHPGYWGADPGASGVCPAGELETFDPVHGTQDDKLFQFQSVGVGGAPVTCSVGGGQLAPGSYQVTLFFAEVQNGPGCPVPNPPQQNVFDVLLEGALVESALHPFGEAGCATSTSDPTGGVVVRSFPVDVQDGSLDVLLQPVSGDAAIAAIELLGPLGECTDGVDNDGDGSVDASDLGCDDAQDPSERSDALVCDDGLDNDGDGLADYPADPGCGLAVSGSESPECDDGADNDGDGFADLADPDCHSAADPQEARARTCGLGAELALGAGLLLALSALRRRGTG